MPAAAPPLPAAPPSDVGCAARDADHAAALFNLEAGGNIYSRLGNPTAGVLEARLAALEGGAAALAVASGHAAQLLAFHTLMEPGCNIVASRKLYGGSITQLSQSFKRMGWGVTFVEELERAVGAKLVERAELRERIGAQRAEVDELLVARTTVDRVVTA